MIVLVVLFIAGSFLASTLLGPKRTHTAKRAPYECGIVPETEPVERFSTKFYLVAMAFIVLDVEIVFERSAHRFLLSHYVSPCPIHRLIPLYPNRMASTLAIRL